MTEKIVIQCDQCGKKYRLSAEKYAGKKIRCPNCREAVSVRIVPPEPDPEPTPEKKSRPLLGGVIFTLFAAAVGIGVYYGIEKWPDIRAWYIQAQSGLVRKTVSRPDPVEKKLSEAVRKDLDLDENDARIFTEVEKSFIRDRMPDPLPQPNISLDQRRVFHKYCWRSMRMLRELREKNPGPVENYYKKIIQKEMVENTFLAYMLKKEEKYLTMWKNCLLMLIRNNSGQLQAWHELGLLEKLAYLDKTGHADHPGLETLSRYVFKRLQSKSAALETQPDAARLLYASHFFRDTPFGDTLYKKASAILTDKTRACENLGDQSVYFRFLSKYIKATRRAGKTIPQQYLDDFHRTCQDLAILLEADGCLPQVNGVDKRINLREPVYHAAQLFDRGDFRFIAFGGLRMPEAYPPSVCSVFLRNRSQCVMRSNWNISYHRSDVLRDWMGDDQVSLTMDMKTGEISVFGYTHPLCIIRNRDFGTLEKEKTIWKQDRERDYLHLETSSRTMDIYYIKPFSTWIIRQALKDASSGPGQEILFYRSEVDRVKNDALLSHRYIRIVWSHDKHLWNKQAGNVYIQSPDSRLEYAETASEIEGCYWRAQRKLNPESELIVTAVPYVRPKPYEKGGNSRYFRRDVLFSVVEKEKPDIYSAFQVKRDAYKKIMYENAGPENKDPVKTIRISGQSVIINPKGENLTEK